MPLDELATRLSISTAEVEGIERRGVPDEDGNLGLFRVGKVLEAEKHPNADRLQLCRVDVGEGEPRQIVCGAWNFGAGSDRCRRAPRRDAPRGAPARAAEGARRALRRDDPRRGRDRPRHRPLRDHGAAGDRARDAARRRASARRGGAARRVDGQPPRPALDLRDRARGCGALRARARPAAGHRPGAGRRTSRSTSRSTTSRAARATSAGSSATCRSASRRSG